MEAFLGRKYKLSQSDNFDEFMKALGVSLIARKMGNAVIPTVELKKEGDEYHLLTSSSLKTTETKFKPGVEMDVTTPDGRKVKTIFTIDGNIIYEEQTANDGKVTTIERIFAENELKMVCKVDDIISNRIYKFVG